MEERLAAVARIERIVDLRACERRAHRQEPAGETFGQAHQVGRYARLLAREHRAGTAKPGHHFIGDEEHIVATAQRRHLGQDSWSVHAHSACAQNQRFDDQGRKIVRLRRKQSVQRIDRQLLRTLRGKRQIRDLEQHLLIGGVEQAALADRHRAEHVAVIAVLERDHTPAGRPRLCQNPTAILIATSTAVDPESEKNTCFRPRGAKASSLAASRSAGSCVKPAKIT